MATGEGHAGAPARPDRPDRPDLRFRALDPHADDEGSAGLLRGWSQAVARGFHEGRAGEELQRRWLEAVRAEREPVVRGAWPTAVALGDGLMPVATLLSFTGTINTGASLAPLHMITDVTVAPTHRRQGLLRELVTRDLAEAAGRGLPLAALTVSEGGIYGRFGFGPAHRTREVEVDVTSGLGLHPPAGEEVTGGRVELVEPLEAWPAVRSVFARHLAGQRGQVDRPAFYRPIQTGEFDFREQESNPRLRAAVHLDAGGEADGYALYEHRDDQGRPTVRVHDLVAPDPAVELRLWRLLAEMDLTERLHVPRLALEHPLDHAAVDPRRVRTTRVGDLLWLRVLDVAAALTARPWYADGSVVLGVADPLGDTDGGWRVEVHGGAAAVQPTTDEPGVRLPADVLGALYLGGVGVDTLAAAGRIAGRRDHLAAFAAMADGGPAPFCTTGF